jgi:competence protein ComEA
VLNADDHFEFDDYSWRRMPVLFADRLGVRPVSVVVGAISVLAAGFGAWWALRPPPPPPDETLPVIADISALSSTTTAGPQVLIVHVDGAVARPGVHDVVSGSRVIDAVEAAGGLADNADRSRVNLAQQVADGQRIWIPAIGEVAPEVVIGAAATAGGVAEWETAGLIDLSRASAAQLETLPGIGPSLAAAIVEHRDREGSFRNVDDLLGVTGIGPAKLEALRDLVHP